MNNSSCTDTLFDLDKHILSKFVEKNSFEFDSKLLKSLFGKTFKTKKFDTEMRKIFKQKSSLKLWFERKTQTRWNTEQGKYSKCDYVCCPSSRKTMFYFCLILEEDGENTTIKNGFLSAV